MSFDPTAIDFRTDPRMRRIEGETFHGHKAFSVPIITEVLPGLWQGGCYPGLVLPREIDHVISLYPWESYQYAPGHELKSVLAVRMLDAEEIPISIHSVASWINECRKTGVVLVHCQAGLNRSALVLSLALIANGDFTEMKDVIAHLREKRCDAVLCNTFFEDYLLSS